MRDFIFWVSCAMCVCFGIADEPLLMLSAPPEPFLLFPVKGAYMVQWIVRGCNHKRFEMLRDVSSGYNKCLSHSLPPESLGSSVICHCVFRIFAVAYVYMYMVTYIISFPFSVLLFILNFNSHLNISTIKYVLTHRPFKLPLLFNKV